MMNIWSAREHFVVNFTWSLNSEYCDCDGEMNSWCLLVSACHKPFTDPNFSRFLSALSCKCELSTGAYLVHQPAATGLRFKSDFQESNSNLKNWTTPGCFTQKEDNMLYCYTKNRSDHRLSISYSLLCSILRKCSVSSYQTKRNELIKLKCTEVFGGVIESTKLFYNSIMKVKRPQTVNLYEETLQHYGHKSFCLIIF